MSNFILNRSNDLSFIQSYLENNLRMPQSSHKNITFTSYFLFQQLLFTINKAICMRLDGIENSIEILNGRTKYLEERMDELVDNVKNVNGTSTSQISPNPSKKGAGYLCSINNNVL